MVKHILICRVLAYKSGIRGGRRKITDCENLSFQKTFHYSRGREEGGDGTGLWVLSYRHGDCCRAQSPLGDLIAKKLIHCPQEGPCQCVSVWSRSGKQESALDCA